MSLTEIKAYWENRALSADLADAVVTHPDVSQRLLEIDAMLDYLPDNQVILDVGCGNGFSTAVFADHARQIVGIDYSEAMIARARSKYGHLENVRFEVQDVLHLDLPAANFDVAISQRCLINLTTWQQQQQAIRNVARTLKPQGFFFLQEGTQQGRARLNQVREVFELSRMPDVSYNLDFDEETLWPFLRQFFRIVEVRRFGLYDLISRVVHPLLVSPEEPRYDARINEIARRVATHLQGTDDLSREFFAVLRRLDGIEETP